MTVVVERYHIPKSQLYEGSRGGHRGNVHLHVLEDVKLGRLVRKSGECLCSKKHGSYEREPDDNETRCPSCDRIAKKNGIEWPSERLVQIAVEQETWDTRANLNLTGKGS